MTSASDIKTVELALDSYVKTRRGRGIEPTGFYARTLAKVAGCETARMSRLLQEFRYCQRRPGATRYVVACQGYGAKARWHILAKPGSDPHVVQEARREQALWVARDGLNRIVRDTLHEVFPGLRGKALDAAIEREVETMVAHMQVSVKAVERALARNGD
jgi:hypothetical protein